MKEINIDGVDYILTPKDETKPTVQGRWKPEGYTKYYYVTSNGNVKSSGFSGLDSYDNAYNFGNCFKTEQEAILASKAMRRHNLLLSYVLGVQGDLKGKWYIYKCYAGWQKRTSNDSLDLPDAILMQKETAEIILKDTSFLKELE